jgi:nicotinate-nucleotide adenylyltransferase
MAIGRKIGLFGGTFDPIHSAHLTVAREAITQAGLDEVLFVPAAHPPHKTGASVAPYEHRYRMVELACQGEAGFVPSRLEEGEGRSYSILTIERIRGQLGPADSIHFLIGADAFAEIATWRRWEEVVGSVSFLVVTRPGHDYEVPPGARVQRLDTLALPVSSSDIRARLAAGRDVPELPGAVRRYIEEHALYR